jgi:uncharacterized protein (TIRG00374 family)
MGRRSRFSFWGRRVLELSFLAVAVVFLVKRVPRLASIGSVLANVRWPWLLVGVATEVVSVLTLTVLQQSVLASGGAKMRFSKMVPVTLAANAVSLSIPAGVVVAEGYVFKQYRRLGARPVVAAWAELSAGAIAAAALAGLAFAGALVVGGRLRTLLIGPFAVVLVGSAVAAGLFQRTKALSAFTTTAAAFAERHVPSWLQSRVRSFEDRASKMAELTPGPRDWIISSAAATTNWLLDSMVLVAAILSIGQGVPWRWVLLVYAGGQVLAELPITPGGLGVVEGGMVGLLTRSHMSSTEATAAVLVYRGMSFWLLIAVGWIAAGRIRAVSTAPSSRS